MKFEIQILLDAGWHKKSVFRFEADDLELAKHVTELFK